MNCLEPVYMKIHFAWKCQYFAWKLFWYLEAIVILKLLHYNSIAVFSIYFYLSKHEIQKLLWWWVLIFWIIINFWILWKTNIEFCVKNYLLKIMEDVAVGILQTQFNFWGRILQQKKQQFSFYRHFIFNVFKKILQKELLNN